MNTNKFFLHAGGSKTGSTAIQNFCESNTDRLQQYGVSYENRLEITSDYMMGSGNGFALYQAVMARQSDDVATLLKGHMGSTARCVCSSEYFADLSKEDWMFLRQGLARLDYDTRVIFYVRDVIPFLRSAYDQAIKRHGVSASFEDWSTDAEWQHVDAIRVISSVFDAGCVSVVHYDEVKHGLIRNFLDLVGVDQAFTVDGETQGRTINRSLTRFERQALRRINRSLGDAFCAELSDHLIYKRPEWKEAPENCRTETIEQLRARFEPDIRWINQTFFDSREMVALSSAPECRAEMHEAPASISSDKERDCQRDITDWCVEQLRTAQAKGIEFVAERLRNIDWKNAADAAIPTDFDPVAYLLFNTDVLRAGVPPFEHYILAGKMEGRRYQWGSN